MSTTVSQAEEGFMKEWELNGVPGSDIVAQYQFHDTRKWRFDFAFPSQLLAIEIQGMGRTAPAFCHHCKAVARCPCCSRPPIVSHAGGHQTPKGMREDSEKQITAILLGWRILSFPTSDYRPDHWVSVVNEVLLTLCPTTFRTSRQVLLPPATQQGKTLLVRKRVLPPPAPSSSGKSRGGAARPAKLSDLLSRSLSRAVKRK